MTTKDILSQLIANKALELIKNPRVSKLLQSEPVTRVMTQAFQAQGALRAKLDEQLKAVAGEVAKKMNLATKQDVYRISNQVERLQRAQRDLETKKDVGSKTS